MVNEGVHEDADTPCKDSPRLDDSVPSGRQITGDGRGANPRYESGFTKPGSMDQPSIDGRHSHRSRSARAIVCMVAFSVPLFGVRDHGGPAVVKQRGPRLFLGAGVPSDHLTATRTHVAHAPLPRLHPPAISHWQGHNAAPCHRVTSTLPGNVPSIWHHGG
jgi:hypothetical protein